MFPYLGLIWAISDLGWGQESLVWNRVPSLVGALVQVASVKQLILREEEEEGLENFIISNDIYSELLFYPLSKFTSKAMVHYFNSY